MHTLKRFPPLVICFAFDVEHGDTKSGFKPAEDHFGSEEHNPMYAQPRIEGYAALLRNTQSRIVIPGKDEERFKGQTIDIGGVESPMWQGYLIRKMLIEDYGADPGRIEWIASTGTTTDAAYAARQYLQDHKIVPGEGSVEFCTSYYHCVRASNMALRNAGLPPLLTPAESFTLAEAMEEGRQKEAEERLRSFGGHLSDPRVILEIRGMAHELLGISQPQTKGW